MAKLLATLLVLISATVLTRPAEAIDCPLTRQRAFDSIVDRLRHIVPNPEAVGLQERVCVVAVAIQMFRVNLGELPSVLQVRRFGTHSTLVQGHWAKVERAESP